MSTYKNGSSALTLLAPNPRARGARRPSDVGQQSDPLAPRAALRGCWPPAQLRFSSPSGLARPTAHETLLL